MVTDMTLILGLSKEFKTIIRQLEHGFYFNFSLVSIKEMRRHKIIEAEAKNRKMLQQLNKRKKYPSQKSD